MNDIFRPSEQDLFQFLEKMKVIKCASTWELDGQGIVMAEELVYRKLLYKRTLRNQSIYSYGVIADGNGECK